MAATPLPVEATQARLDRVHRHITDLQRDARSLVDATSLAGWFEPRSIPAAELELIRQRLFDLNIILNGVEVA